MKYLTFASIIIATLIISVGYTLIGEWLPVLVVVGLGTIWVISEWQSWRGVASIELVAFIGIAGWGIWLEATAIWMLLGTAAALAAWDLSHFSQRTSLAELFDNQSMLQQAHLQRLFLVIGLGLLLGGVALGLQISLNLGGAGLLGLLMVTTLSVAVGLIRRIRE